MKISVKVAHQLFVCFSLALTKSLQDCPNKHSARLSLPISPKSQSKTNHRNDDNYQLWFAAKKLCQTNWMGKTENIHKAKMYYWEFPYFTPKVSSQYLNPRVQPELSKSQQTNPTLPVKDRLKPTLIWRLPQLCWQLSLERNSWEHEGQLGFSSARVS